MGWWVRGLVQKKMHDSFIFFTYSLIYLTYGSSHEGAAVLLPGFAIK